MSVKNIIYVKMAYKNCDFTRGSEAVVGNVLWNPEVSEVIITNSPLSKQMGTMAMFS